MDKRQTKDADLQIEVPQLDDTPESELEYEVIDGDRIKVTGYHGDADGVRIPEKINGMIVRVVDLHTVPLSTVIMPDSVDKFLVNDGIQYIKIPKSVHNLQKSFFGQRKELIYMELHDRLEEIDADFFDGCESLVRLEMPKKYRSTSSSIPSLQGCKSLKEVVIDGDVRSIGPKVFSDCSSLECVTIPDKVVRISEEGFKKCTGLKEVTLHEYLRTIGQDAFADCTSLESVTMNSSDSIYMEKGVFKGCTALKNMKLPEKLKSLNAETFYGCSALENVSLPESMEEIDDAVFGGCVSLKQIEIPDNVKYVNAKTFAGCTSLESVTLGEGVRTIEGRAFADCTSLSKLTVKGQLSRIREDAFQNCNRLFRIYYGDKVYASPAAFIAAINGMEPSLEDRLRYLDDCEEDMDDEDDVYGENLSDEEELSDDEDWYDEDWYDEEDLYDEENLVISWMEYIKDSAYENLVGLKTIQMTSGVDEIGKYAFRGCTSLTTVELSSDITHLEEEVFAHCISLVEITIPEGVKEIGKHAFWDCESLTSITIPKTVTKIAQDAFEGCDALEQIIVEENPKYLVRDGVLFERRKSGKIIKVCPKKVPAVYELPDNIHRVPDGAFKDCINLTKFVFHDGVESVGEEVFAGCTAIENIVYGGVEYPNVRYYDYGRAGYTMKQIEEIMAKEEADREAAKAAEREAEERAQEAELCRRFCEPDAFDEEWVLEAMQNPSLEERFIFQLNKEKTGWIVALYDIEDRAPSSKPKKVVVVPDQKDGLPVTEIGWSCFTTMYNVKAIVLPDTITCINENAFFRCYDLEQIKLPKGLVSLEGQMFGATKIKSLRLPDGLKRIDATALKYCNDLEKLYIPDGLQQLEEGTFEGLNPRITYKGVTYAELSDFMEAFNKEKEKQ